MQPETSPSVASARLACDQCTRTFNRPSHLDRHRRTHLPPSQRRVVSCHYCERSFSRHDVLLRHLRTAHDIHTEPKTTQQKSCYRCVRYKLKCNRNHPCGSCASANRQNICAYPAETQSDSHGAEVSLLELLQRQTPSNLQSGSYTQPHSHSRQNDKEILSQTPELVSKRFETLGFGQQPGDRSNAGHSQSLDPLLLPTTATNDRYNNTVFDEGSTPGAGNSNSSIISETFSNSANLDFRGSGFNWLDFDIPNADLVMNHSAAMASSANPGLAVWPSIPAPAMSNVAPLPSIQTSRPIVLPWPFEQGPDARPAHFPLPRLHEVLPKAIHPSNGAQMTVMDSLTQLLAESRVPKANQLSDPHLSSGIELLQHLTDVYFTDFHIIQPIVHTPTWKLTECPMILLASMACIGSVLSKDPMATELTDNISELCSSMITWLAMSDSANYSNITYLAALCLHQIYSLGSGNRQLYQNADRTRGVLIGSLRGLGLLSSRISGQEDTSEPSELSNICLDSEWASWAAREQANRVVWASFEYDCSLCTLTSRRGAVDLSELPARLPCSETLYEASNSQAWFALKSRSPIEAQGPSLSAALRAVMNQQPLSEHISSWSKRLCAQMIGRLLWDVKQLETLSTTQYFALPSLFKAHQHSKTSLLCGLSFLLECMDQPCSTAELVSYNVSSLLCHYSHIYASDDIMDTIVYIVRSIVSRGLGSRHKSVELARRKVTSAMKSNPIRTRKLLWHAGQIVAVANEYLVSAPCEIMRLFMAYIFILAYAKYCPQVDQAVDIGSVRLDMPSRYIQNRKFVDDWIRNGGPAQIGSATCIHVKSSTAHITRDAQSMFQRLHNWGLAERFSKILQYFEENEV